MTDFLLGHCWPLLVGVAVKSLCVLALAAAAALALRRSSAAARHLAWRLALTGLLLLPLLSSLPAVWQVPLAPRALLMAPDAPVVTPALPAINSGGVRADRPPAPNPGGVREDPIPPLPTPPGLGAGGMNWPLWACALWLAGFVLTLTPTLLGLASVGGLARRSAAVPDGPLRELTTHLAHDLGIVITPVRLLLGEAGTPMTWGWRRPVILLPPGADAWPEDRLRAVLLHELAHIARADWPAQMAAQLACACYWFNPAVWLAARQARVESERACDDRVLLAGVPAPDYARHLLDVARALNTQTLPAVLPMVNASTLRARLLALLDTARRRGEAGKRMNVVLTEALLLPAFLSWCVAFATPLPPSRTVRLDAPSYQIIGQANAATSALRSLRAHLHAVTTMPDKKNSFTTGSTVVFQRPNLARIEIPGVGGETFVSDGQRVRLVDHDGSYNSTTAVDWNGDDMTGDDESQPFIQYFFRPDFHRLGADVIDEPGFLGAGGVHAHPLPVTGTYLGVRSWQGAQYQVVAFTRDARPIDFLFKNITIVYVGADHLVHRVVGQAYFDSGVRTDDVWLTDLQINQISPPSAFHLPALAHKPALNISLLGGGACAPARKAI